MSSSDTTAYNKDTTMNEEKLAEFLMGSIVDDTASVFGVGPKNKESLAAAGINSTFQLIGQFLLMREPGMNTREHCDAFAAWLKTKGISSHRNQIIRVIAEKVNTMLPGLYNEEELE